MFKDVFFSPLSDKLNKTNFDCGVAELNDFLFKRAKSFIKRGLCSVQALVCEQDNELRLFLPLASIGSVVL